MTQTPRYLALDMGVTTGYALAEGDCIIKSGARNFSVKKTEHIGRRGIMFYNFLLSIGRVDEIYYEKINFTGGNFKDKDGKWAAGVTNDNREFFHGLMMLVNMYAAGYGVPTFGVWPGTLKKAFAGHGHAEKGDMCRAAHEMGWQGGLPGTDRCNDEADAIGILATELRARYGMKVHFAKPGLLPGVEAKLIAPTQPELF